MPSSVTKKAAVVKKGGADDDDKERARTEREAASFANFKQNSLDPTTLAYHLKKMDDKSLDDVNNELREAFMQMKDLSSRCMIDMEQIQKNDQRMFYIKPNSVYLEDPETQKQFRQRLLRTATQMKDTAMDGRFALADQMNAEMKEHMVTNSLADPGQMRPFLSDYFRRHLYQLQHKKYKMLSRWAHFALTSFTVDKIGQYGTQMYAQLEYEIESTLKRQERLEQKDGFEELRDGAHTRPETAQNNSSAQRNMPRDERLQELQEERKSGADRRKEPISALRIDDFEVYLRLQTYQTKIFRPCLKFIARAKWLPTTESLNIFKTYQKRYDAYIRETFDNQLKHVDMLRKRYKKSLLKKTEDLTIEMEEVMLEDYEAARLFLEGQLRTQGNASSSAAGNSMKKGNMPVRQLLHEKAPQRITNLLELYVRVENMSSQFGVQGKVEIDNGYSFAYQVQVYFMTFYQKQIIESTFAHYNQLSRDPQMSSKSQEQSSAAYDNDSFTSTIITGAATEQERIQQLIYEMSVGLRDILNPSKTDIDKLYEKFDGEFAQDFTSVQRTSMKQLLMIDFMLVDLQNTNAGGTSSTLLKKGKRINEQIPDLKKVFEDCQVSRLKRSTWVDTQVLLTPNISQLQQRQDATFGSNYHVDLQLQALLDFVDVNDPSMVTVLYQSMARIYGRISQETHGMNYLSDEVQLDSILRSDRDAKKFFDSFSKGVEYHGRTNEHRDKISREEVLRRRGQRYINQDRRAVDTYTSQLRNLPSHIVQCYMTLKHMKMRQTKNRLLKVLNFYRSLQKRIALELQEFAGREAVNSDVKVRLPQEAYQVGQKARNIEEKFTDIGQLQSDGPGATNDLPTLSKQKVKTADDKRKEMELEQDEGTAQLINLKRWKYKGSFDNKFLATCPMPQTIDGTNDRPLEERGHESGISSRSTGKQHISYDAKVYLNRIDTYQINDEAKEINVIDDFGVSIIYDATVQDMVLHEQYLLQVGTYFIKKTEHDFDFHKYEFSLVDRMETLDDLLEEDLSYQYLKAQILLAFLDALEHQCDPLIQQRLMQIIVDIMAWKPRFDQQRSWYFKQAYEAERRYLETLLKLLKEVVNFQMDNEARENAKVHDWLRRSMQFADSFSNMNWTDVNTGHLKDEMEARQFIIDGPPDLSNVPPSEKQNPLESNDPEISKDLQSQISGPSGFDPNQKRASTGFKNPRGSTGGASHTKTTGSVSKRPQKTFVEELGLPAVDEKEEMLAQAALDPIVDDLIDRDAAFMKNHEGYPYKFRVMSDSMSKNSFSNGTSMYSSRVFGILDFYESLAILPNVYSLINQGQAELRSDLKPAGPIQEIILKTVYLELVSAEFTRARAQAEGRMPADYEAQPFIESDLVMGSSDKLAFLAKDMVANFSRSLVTILNPVLVGKMDLNAVNAFQFPRVPRSFFLPGGSGGGEDVNWSRSFIELQLRPQKQTTHFFPRLKEDETKVEMPPSLLLYCNLAELLRLREQLILGMADTLILTESYDKQKNVVNLSGLATISPQPLGLTAQAMAADDEVNFVEDGSLLAQLPGRSGLAVDELCPSLRANLNMRNPESIQTLMLDGGLANLKCTVHYQLVQKQALTIAVMTNAIILAPFQRALAEIELLEDEGIRLPNGLIDYSEFTNVNKKQLDFIKLSKVKSYTSSALYTQCVDLFVDIAQIKLDQRTQIKIQWDEYRRKLEQLSHEAEKQVAQQEQEAAQQAAEHEAYMAALMNVDTAPVEVKDPSARTSFKKGNQRAVIAHPISKYAIYKFLHDYKLSLVHLACRSIHQQSIVGMASRLELLHVTQREMLPRLNFYMGLPPDRMPFQLSQPMHSMHHARLGAAQLRAKEPVLKMLGELGEVPEELCSTIPAPSEIINMKLFKYEMDKEEKEKKGPIEDVYMSHYKGNIQHSDADFRLLIFKNVTIHFDLENRQARMLRRIFADKPPKEPSGILHAKLAIIYNYVIDLFEYCVFEARNGIKPVDFIEMVTSSEQGRQYWYSSCEDFGTPSRLIDVQVAERAAGGEAPVNPQVTDTWHDSDEKVAAAERLPEEKLGQKIVEQITKAKRTQMQVFEDFCTIKEKFDALMEQVVKSMQLRGPLFKIDDLINQLKTLVKLNQAKNLKNGLQCIERVCKKPSSRAAMMDHLRFVRMFTGIDLQAPFFLNGLLLNQNLCQPRSLRMTEPFYAHADGHAFKKVTAGLDFVEDLVPYEATLLTQLVETFNNPRPGCPINSSTLAVEKLESQYLHHNPAIPCWHSCSPTQNLNYYGQLFFPSGPLQSELRSAYLHVSDKEYAHIRLLHSTADTLFNNLLMSSEMGSPKSLDYVSDKTKSDVLSNLCEASMLKLLYMIMVAGRTFPLFFGWHKFDKEFVQPTESRLQWKINAYVEAEKKRRKKEMEAKEFALDSRRGGGDDESADLKAARAGRDATALVKQQQVAGAGVRRNAADAMGMDEAVRTYLQTQAQQVVIGDEINKVLMHAAIYAMDVQCAAISRSLELCSNKIDKHVMPLQGFCATLYDDINRSPHLEIASKLPQIQVFLTKLRNRGLPIKTLTSGHGIVSTFKDLNECIHDFCCEIVQFGERQLKLRTDAYAAQINQLVEIIQFKDTKLQALKYRCCHVYDNIQRVTNSRVFESSNTLVYALDRAMQEVRFYQEHIGTYEAELEKAVGEKFRLRLEEMRRQLGDKDRALAGRHVNLMNVLATHIAAAEKEIQDKIMATKKRAKFEDGGGTLEELVAVGMQRKRDAIDERKRVAEQARADAKRDLAGRVKYPPAAFLDSKIDGALPGQQLPGFDADGNPKVYPVEESHDELYVVSPQQAMRLVAAVEQKLMKQRATHEWRFYHMKRKLEDKIAFLEEKMSSNKDIWEKLVMEQERQRTGQTELNITKKLSQNNERAIDRLKEQLARNEKEKQVLESVSANKASKLQELEYRMKGLDLSKNVNVEKLIDLLMQQDNEIKRLKESERYWEARVTRAEQGHATKQAVAKRQLELEMETKAQAIQQVNMLQKQVKMYQMDKGLQVKAEASSEGWKTKFDELFKITQRLIQENQVLTEKLNLKGTVSGNQTLLGGFMKDVADGQRARSSLLSKNAQSAVVLKPLPLNHKNAVAKNSVFNQARLRPAQRRLSDALSMSGDRTTRTAKTLAESRGATEQVYETAGPLQKKAVSTFQQGNLFMMEQSSAVSGHHSMPAFVAESRKLSQATDALVYSPPGDGDLSAIMVPVGAAGGLGQSRGSMHQFMADAQLDGLEASKTEGLLANAGGVTEVRGSLAVASSTRKGANDKSQQQ